jgi:CAAX prenyl protease-like protein
MADLDPEPNTGATSAAEDPKPPRSSADPSAAAWPYVLPLAGFLAATAVEAQVSTGPDGAVSPVWYPLAYAAKVVIVSAIVWSCRASWRDLAPRPSLGSLALAVVVGLAVIAAWVGLDGRYPALPFLGGRRASFDPTVLRPAARAGFLAVRMFGLVALVPVIEELFYRSFLMRWVVNPDFARVPIGTVTPAGLAITSGVFALSHPEWLPALLTGLAWGWLVGRTRSVAACAVSHATANLVLGIYVLATGDWKFW